MIIETSNVHQLFFVYQTNGMVLFLTQYGFNQPTSANRINHVTFYDGHHHCHHRHQYPRDKDWLGGSVRLFFDGQEQKGLLDGLSFSILRIIGVPISWVLVTLFSKGWWFPGQKHHGDQTSCMLMLVDKIISNLMEWSHRFARHQGPATS